jgi:hypothetical protein
VSAIVVPVLLTYESATTQAFDKTSAEYRTALKTELVKIHQKFKVKNTLTNIRIELFLLPMFNKKTLLDQLHMRLVAAQNI